MDSELLIQVLNQVPPEVLGRMIEEINDPKRFVKKDLLQKEVPQYLNPYPSMGGSNAPIRV